MDIAPQDERMVGAHLESCESCAKFHHQLQQVIMAAEEVPLPDEMAPNPPEALARNIMEGLPQPKGNPFEFFSKLFAKKEKELPNTIDRNASKFPHVTRGAQAEAEQQLSKPTGKQKEEDHSGTSNRLKALARGPIENREAQSTTRSLGEKLGFAAPAGGGLTDDQPLTLAESIRRKISEKPPEAEEEEMMAPPVPPQPAAVDDSWGSPASSPSRAPANMAAPPNIPQGRPQANQPGGQAEAEQPVLGSWGKPSPIESSNSWGGQNVATQSRDDWNFDTNSQQGAPQMGGAQQGGQQMAAQARGSSIDPFAAPGQPSADPNMQAPSADSWGGWNDASAPKGAGGGDSDWGPPPAGGAWDEPASAAASNNWGGTASKPSVPMPASQVNSHLLETGMIKLGDLGLPSAKQQPTAAAPVPPAATTPDTTPAWGASPQSPAGAAGGAADPWGSSGTDSWGGSPSANAWGGAPDAAAQAGGSNSWGTAGGQQQTSPAPQPTGDWGEPASDSWGGSPTGGNSWGQPGAAPGGSWDQPAGENKQPAWGEGADWSQGAQPAAPQAMPESQQQAGSSSQAAALGRGRQQAWSLEAEQVETGTWRAFAPSGESLSGGAAARPAAAAAPAGNQQSFAPQQDEQSRWDVPIQERIKAGGTQSSPNLPTMPPTPVAQPSPFGQPFNQAAAPAAPVAPPQPVKPQEPLLPSDNPAPTKSGWNFPVYEAPDQLTIPASEQKAANVSNAWDAPATAQPAQSAPAPMGLSGWGEPPAPPQPVQPETKVSGSWDMPAAPSFSQPAPQPVQPAPMPAQPAPMPGQPGGSVPVDSIMDRLGNVLNNNEGGAAATATAAASQWDVSIQERQQQAAAAAAAAAQTPQQPASSPWGQIPEPQAPQAPQAMPSPGGWGSPPQMPAQSGATGSPWDAPPTPMAPPVNPFAQPMAAQAQPAQAPAAASWDSPSSQGPASSWDAPVAAQPQTGSAWDAPVPTPAGSWDAPGTSGATTWDSPAVAPQAPAQGGWDNPVGQNPITNPMANPMGSPIGAPMAPVGSPIGGPAPLPVPQPAVAAAAAAGQQAGTPAQGGLFQNLDDNAIDRLFSENLGVNDAGAASGAPQQQQAPTPAFTAPRWNPGENGGGAPAQPSFAAPPQSFGAPQQAPAADSGAPKISAITPRGTAPQDPQMPGVDRRNQAPFAMPTPAPQTMAPPQSMAPQPMAPQPMAPQPMASPFAAPEPAPVAAAAAPPAPKNGLFDLDDSAMDELFSKNLGVNEQAIPSNQAPQPQAQQASAPVFQSPPVMTQQAPQPPANPFSRPAPQLGAQAMPNPFAPLTAPPTQPAPPQAPQQQAQPAWGQPPSPPVQQAQPGMQQPPPQGGLFSIDDSMIDKIFADNAAAPQPPQPVATPQFNVNEAVKEIEVAQHVPPPKIAGVGRLDPRTDTSADSGSGRIASIGKFLLDQKDLEKIGKLTGSDLSETKMRILTMEAAQELQTLLQHIGTQETVIGSVIVGHDGLLIANTMPPDIDAESIGVWALGLYMSTEMVIKKMGQDRVHQIVSRTPKGYVVIADFGGGLLVTVSDGTDTDSLIPLMRSITQLVAQ
jgi:predicted regulator of Ras-like GTPase activity (Roadblock/LC7/MglB family)